MANTPPEIEDLITHTNALSWDDTSPLLAVPAANNNSTVQPSLSLVGKVFSLQPISRSNIKSNLLLSWKFLKSLTFEDRDDDLLVFTFEDMDDLHHVLDSSPWNIKGSPLFLKYWATDAAIEDFDFNKGEYWIQVHGLPLDMLTVASAKAIGSSLGDLISIDNADNSKPSRKSFLRIRVSINLQNPLSPGFTHHRASKPSIWVQYKYERLSDYCYVCGRLGHMSFTCAVTPKPIDHGRYGALLKASSPFTNRIVQLISPKSSPPSNNVVRPHLPPSPPESTHPSSINSTQHSFPPKPNSTQPCLTIPEISLHPILTNSVSLCRDIPSAAFIGKSSIVNFQLTPHNSPLMFTQTENQNSLPALPLDTTPLSESISSNPMGPTCTSNKLPTASLDPKVSNHPVTKPPSQHTSFPNLTFDHTCHPSKAPDYPSLVPFSASPPKPPIPPKLVAQSKKRFHPYSKDPTPKSSLDNHPPKKLKQDGSPPLCPSGDEDSLNSTQARAADSALPPPLHHENPGLELSGLSPWPDNSCVEGSYQAAST
ncbi:hypothetical protein SLA2020_318770 [Shorea laevis]